MGCSKNFEAQFEIKNGTTKIFQNIRYKMFGVGLAYDMSQNFWEPTSRDWVVFQVCIEALGYIYGAPLHNISTIFKTQLCCSTPLNCYALLSQ